MNNQFSILDYPLTTETDFPDSLIDEQSTKSAEILDIGHGSEKQSAPSIIVEAVARLPMDPGAIYEPDVLNLVKLLRKSNPAEFARLRNSVKSSKVLNVAEFDRLTLPIKETSSENESIFSIDEIWPEIVNGSELLDSIVSLLGRHVIADLSTLQAASLWTLFTWALDLVQVAPIANITAPEKRCGKTELLSAIGRLAYRPMQVSDIATAALFRSIELWRPTLLIDEVDAFLRDNDEGRGILNAGFTRDSAFVIRCVGDDHLPTKFGIWGAKALCGIGKIADTLADRSIPLRMRRKKLGEQAERLRHSDPEEWQQLRSKISRFIADNSHKISRARPPLIYSLNDRANDCWEPLLQIAEVAGGQWPAIAKAAALDLHGTEEESPTVSVELLADIHSVFTRKGVDRIPTAELIDALCEDEETLWPTWNRGKPISGRQLAKRLRDFGITPNQTIRVGAKTAKGYCFSQFFDAFTRYLSVTESQASGAAASSHFPLGNTISGVTDKKLLKPMEYKGCDLVTDILPDCSSRERY
jgi:Protein of unknown function (DUF3631)